MIHPCRAMCTSEQAVPMCIRGQVDQCLSWVNYTTLALSGQKLLSNFLDHYSSDSSAICKQKSQVYVNVFILVL